MSSRRDFTLLMGKVSSDGGFITFNSYHDCDCNVVCLQKSGKI